MVAIRTELAVLILLSNLQSTVESSSFAYPTPEYVWNANVIVIAKAAREQGQVVLQCSEVLKGAFADRIPLTLGSDHFFRNLGGVPEKSAIFFLRLVEGRVAPYHYLPIARLTAVRAAIAMLDDPGRFLDVQKHPESADFIYLLAKGFGRISLSSTDPSKKPEILMFDESYERIPWEPKAVVTLHFMVAQRDGRSRIVSESKPENALSAYLERLVFKRYRSSYLRQNLPTRFSYTIDARIPEKFSSVRRDEALQYLRDRLTSTNRGIVSSAIKSLENLRDLEAVPLVLGLLTSPDEHVRLAAIEFLGWSRDLRVSAPLCEILRTHAVRYPIEYRISDETAEAIGEIAAPESLPILEFAACHGVYRAIDAMGNLGDERSFEILLSAMENNPAPHMTHIDNALYWLVRRSNSATEPWMKDPVSTTHKTQVARIPQWRAWWDLNKKDFKVVKTQFEAISERIEVE